MSSLSKVIRRYFEADEMVKEAQREKLSAERELKLDLIERREFDLLKIDFNKLRRHQNWENGI